jgi:hypothetical protein
MTQSTGGARSARSIEIGVVEPERGEGFAQKPFDVIGENAQEYMRADP